MGLTEKLDAFKAAKRVTTKGSLSTVVQLTRAFSQDTMPICQQDYITDKEGRVKGLGGPNLKAILKEYGIERTLSSEGGRTSRGSMGIMSAYVDLINLLPRPVDFPAIEGYWIGEVKKYFAGKPFRLNVDGSCSMAYCVEDLIKQAKKRERENPGTKYAGTVLQHLVAAKLSLIVPEIEINGVDVADAPTGRTGDFAIGDSAVHCTMAPSQQLVEKCGANIGLGLRPVIITVRDRVKTALDLLEDAGLAERAEVWDIQQFVSANVYEHGLFERDARKRVMERIVERYNAIVEECEYDPSLKIAIGQ